MPLLLRDMAFPGREAKDAITPNKQLRNFVTKGHARNTTRGSPNRYPCPEESVANGQ